MPFDQDKPAANTSLRVSNPQILDNQEALQDAINREHIFSGTDAGTQTGDHTQGSARCFSQESAPATRIDGNGFLSTDLGSIWVRPSDNQIATLTATLPTWTPISTELYESFLADPRVFLDTLGVDGNFEVGTGSEFTVEAATGNVATDGTLNVAGAGEVVGIATLGDASTLKTSAAPTADAEIANKKYVDDEVATKDMDPVTEVGAAGSTGVTVFSNGFRIARGSESVSAGAEDTISPSGFTAVYKAMTTVREDNNTTREGPKIGNYSGATFTIRNTGGATLTVDWIAIGR